MGITWSITSSVDGFAPPMRSSVGLNLKTKRLAGNHEFPSRKSPEGGACDERGSPSLFVGLVPISMARDHGENALYAFLDKDGLRLLVRKLRGMHDNAFCDHLCFLCGRKETTDVRLYGLNLGHVQSAGVKGRRFHVTLDRGILFSIYPAFREVERREWGREER